MFGFKFLKNLLNKIKKMNDVPETKGISFVENEFVSHKSFRIPINVRNDVFPIHLYLYRPSFDNFLKTGIMETPTPGGGSPINE